MGLWVPVPPVPSMDPPVATDALFVQQTILINVTICCVFILLWTFTIMVCGEKSEKKLPETGKPLRHTATADAYACCNNSLVVGLYKQFTVL